ncbi:hypothetical protein C922_04432 [Plasmodium inui San Antonio 1]|uniref:Uncharacterized protein n=1 Tax=Plasmodium inui San Antonio 1 TaxID=1237626 RepID=W7AIM3_9APIC|nr:hypothetical protein C922_04432 [Plasmodium inui San Antonio 1]EUD65146.1 hypothetical protein C922_04432 [Plasmodium inui San Antonio 1]
MCVRVYYNIGINALKREYNCNKILNNEKLRRRMIRKPSLTENQIQDCLWGLKTYNYGKFDKELLLINPRVEILQSKKSSSVLFNKNPFALVVNGYFEWIDIRGSSKRIPYFVFSGEDDNSSERATEGKLKTNIEELAVQKTEEKSEEKNFPRIKAEGVTIRIRVKKEI